MRLVTIALCILVSTHLAAQASSIFKEAHFSKLRFAHRGGYGPEKTENTVSTIMKSRREGQIARLIPLTNLVHLRNGVKADAKTIPIKTRKNG